MKRLLSWLFGGMAISSAVLLLFGCEPGIQSEVLLNKASTSYTPKQILRREKETVLSFHYTPSGHPYIELFLNNRGPYRFIIDTGSNVSFINEDVAKRLDLPQSAYTVKINPDGPKRPINAPTYRVDKLKVEDLEMREMRLAALSAHKFLQISNTAGVKIDGLLGFSTFADYLYTLDFTQQKLVLQEGELAKLGNPNVLRLDTNHARPVIYGRFGESRDFVQESFPFLIDTGATFGIQLPPSVSSLPYPKIAEYKLALSHIHGQRDLQAQQIEAHFSLGHFQIEHPLVLLYRRGLYPYTDYGTIGMAVLKHLSITFDQRNQYVVLHSHLRSYPPKRTSFLEKKPK